MTCIMAQPPTLDAGNSVPAARLDGLSKWLDERAVLREIDLEVPQGQFLAILGPNGAGKSTLLKLLALLSGPSAGSIQLFGQTAGHEPAALRRRIGLIGHQSMLYRDLTAMDNLVFFSRLYGIRSAAARSREMLEIVGLTDRADDPVGTFSRGMTQRLAIARALLHDPELILADEPFAGLDLHATALLERLLLNLHRQGKTIVMVNHDVDQSLRLAERVIVIREGSLVLDQAAHLTSVRRVAAEVVGP
jgi:heme exporter protein A